MAISYPKYHVNTTKCWGNNIREMVVLKITWEKKKKKTCLGPLWEGGRGLRRGK
jgi:hypothetical protein